MALYGVIIYDFWTDNGAADFMGPVTAIYVASLSVYAGNKEFERWREKHDGRHPGEIFVIFWTILLASILIADFILSKSYKVPESVISAYVVVLGVLAVTRRSRQSHWNELHNGKRIRKPAG